LIHFCSVLIIFRPFVSLRSTTVFLQHNTNIHAPGGIRIHDPSKRAAVDPRLRPRGHCDRPRTRASAVGVRRLTAWAMARPSILAS
jgi:hypothetical protein